MITRQTLTDFRKDFATAVAALEKQYGIVISLGSISFTATSFEVKLTANEGADKDEVNEKEFKNHCRAYGLDPEDYDSRFTFGGKDYVIVGVRPNRRKYPIACQQIQDGVTYNFTAELVRQCLKK